MLSRRVVERAKEAVAKTPEKVKIAVGKKEKAPIAPR